MKAHGLAAALLMAGVSTASAQDASSKSDAFAGYSLLAADGATKHGWHAALGWGFSGRFGVLLDVSGHQGNDVEGSDVSVLSLMAGPRLRFGGGRLRPFVYVLGGVVRTRSGIRVFDVEISESRTDAGGAAGGGLDLPFGERWAFRLGGDYRVVNQEGETTSEPRFSAGIAYRFGGP